MGTIPGARTESPGGLVPGRVLLSFLRIGTAYGVSPRQVFEAAGLEVDLAALEDVFWTVEEFHRLIRAFQAEAGDPAFGVHLGEMFNLLDLRALTTLVNTSPTLEAAARALWRYRDLFHPLLHVDVVRGAKLSRVVYQPDPAIAFADEPFYAELSLSFHLCYARWLIAAPIEVRRLDLKQTEPAYASEIERVFGVPAHFGSRENSFQVDDALLGEPLRGRFEELHRQAESLARSELSKLPDAAALAPRIIRLIREHLAEPDFDLERAAGCLAIGQRTLQRRLRDEGTSFSELRDGVRSREAMERIRNPEWTIDALAESLGFSERASFTHAFARWTGLPPAALRRQLGLKS